VVTGVYSWASFGQHRETYESRDGLRLRFQDERDAGVLTIDCAQYTSGLGEFHAPTDGALHNPCQIIAAPINRGLGLVGAKWIT
jgi:hypothetical protein